MDSKELLSGNLGSNTSSMAKNLLKTYEFDASQTDEPTIIIKAGQNDLQFVKR